MLDDIKDLTALKASVEALPDSVDGIDLRSDKRNTTTQIDSLVNSVMRLSKLSVPVE